jgi:hypothetical protein
VGAVGLLLGGGLAPAPVEDLDMLTGPGVFLVRQHDETGDSQFAPASAWRSYGERAASKATVSVTYRPAVAVPTPDRAASSAYVSPLRR